MPTKGKDPPTNATLPPTEFERLEGLAGKLDLPTATFARMLLRWALPRWRQAWDELGKRAEAEEQSGTMNDNGE